MDKTAIRFGEYVLNPRLGRLKDRAGNTVHLRPKSYRVLEVLADRLGELVSKDALCSAVWRDVSVSDESLTQCISDIRRVLGKRNAQLLRTVPRRGYVLVSGPTKRTDRTRTAFGILFAGVIAAAASAAFLFSGFAEDHAAPSPISTSETDPAAETSAISRIDDLHWRDRSANDARRAEFNEILASVPDDAEAWAGLGMTYWLEVKHNAWGGGRRELDLAVDALERSLQLGGGAEAYRLLAEIRLGAPFKDARSPVDALAAARAAADLAPVDPDNLATLADALLANGHAAQSVSAIEQAITLHPAPPDRFHEIAGRAYLMSREPAKAVEEFGRLHGAGTFGGAGSYMGWYYAASLAYAGRIDDATQIIAVARRTRPERSVESVALSLDRHSDEDSIAIVLDGLRLAGMPD